MTTALETYRARPGEDTLLALLQAQQDGVYNVCYQVLRRPEDAQDAAQQVLMSLLDALPRIKDGAHLKQWLHRAAFHVALDLKKVQKRRREREARVAPMTESSPLSDEVVDAVQAHVSRLQDELRTLVVEHYFERKPLAELAGERGCSTVAVWKKLERAREQLRDSLSRAGYATALDPFFASLKPVAAPKGLLSKAILTKAATAVVVTGTVLKLKLIATVAAGVLAATGALSYAVIHQREERRRQIEELETAQAKIRPVAPVPAKAAPSRVEALPSTSVVARPPEPEELVIFKTQKEFEDAMWAAVSIKDDVARWKALRRIGFLRTSEQFRNVENEIRVHPGTREFEKLFFGMVLLDWAKTDFSGFMEFMMRFPEEAPLTRKKKLEVSLMEGARFNPEAALAYARRLPEGDGRTEILRTLSMFEMPKPEDVLALPAGAERDGRMNALVWKWAEKDPVAAARWVEQLTDPGERAKARSSLASGWGMVDVRAAADWVERTAAGDDRQSLLRDVLRGAADRDPKGAVELSLKAFGMKESWDLDLQRALQSLAAKDPEAGAKLLLQSLPALDELGRPMRAHMIASMGREWVMKDPSAALDWADKLDGADRTETLVAMSAALVRSILSTPKEALSLIDKIPASRREEAISGIVDAWAEIDPRAAADFVRSRPESAAALNETVMRRWANRDLEGALVWARGMPEGLGRDAALRVAVLVVAAGRDPLRGAELTKEIRDQGEKDTALKFVSEQLCVRDLPKAIGLTGEIVDPQLRKAAQNYIVGNLAGRDPQACLALLSQMRDAGPNDYGAFAQSWSFVDPRAAVAWADGLQRPELRESALMYSFQKWGVADREAARAWVTQASLPDKLRQKLMKQVPAPSR